MSDLELLQQIQTQMRNEIVSQTEGIKTKQSLLLRLNKHIYELEKDIQKSEDRSSITKNAKVKYIHDILGVDNFPINSRHMGSNIRGIYNHTTLYDMVSLEGPPRTVTESYYPYIDNFIEHGVSKKNALIILDILKTGKIPTKRTNNKFSL